MLRDESLSILHNVPMMRVVPKPVLLRQVELYITRGKDLRLALLSLL